MVWNHYKKICYMHVKVFAEIKKISYIETPIKIGIIAFPFQSLNLIL